MQGNQFSESQEGVSVRGSDRADSQTYVDGIESGMQLGGRNIYVGGIGLVTDEAQIAKISGLFQVFPGRQILANYQVDDPDFGRPLNLPGASEFINVGLIEPGTQYEDSTSNLQLRFTRTSWSATVGCGSS